MSRARAGQVRNGHPVLTLFALSLLLIAAVIHATWNLLVKRAASGPAFVWLFGTMSAILYAPLAAASYLIQRPELGLPQLAFMFGSGCLHVAYFLLLQQGYRVGDLSVVYPLARGTGPLLATIGAIVILSERPSPLTLLGAALIIGGVFALTGGLRVLRYAHTPGAARFGLLTGIVIAIYTIWDKHAVSALLVPPIVLDWGSNLVRSALLSPMALRRRREVPGIWREHRWTVLGVALFSPLSYILVLTALRVAPVSSIAPGREISILIGTLMGTRLLSEGDARRRLMAAAVMVFGIVALAIG